VLLAGGTLFAQGGLSRRGTLLPKLAKQATAALHPSDGDRLGLEPGERVRLEGPAGAIELEARFDDTVPSGAVFVPYAHAGGDLNRLGAPAPQGLRVRVQRAAAGARVGA